MYNIELSTMNILSWLNTFLLLFASVYAIINLKKIHMARQESELMKIKRVTFYFLTAGIVSLSIAFLIKDIRTAINAYLEPSLADIFFLIAYLMMFLGFDYFWYKTAKAHKLDIKEPFFVLGVICGVFIWLYYLVTQVIMPMSFGLPFMLRLFYCFYPLIVSLIFIFTLGIHPRMKAKIIRTPLWYISNGIFVYFIGFMIKSYDNWMPIPEVVNYLYLFLFILSGAYFTLGFYSAKKKYG